MALAGERGTGAVLTESAKKRASPPYSFVGGFSGFSIKTKASESRNWPAGV
jgi:hypothetical protein